MVPWTVRILFLTLLLIAGSAENGLAQHDQMPAPNPPTFENTEPAAASAEQWYAPKALSGAVEWTYHTTSDNLHPDGNEQQMVWLVNRARANPTQEGIWLATMPNSDVDGARTYWGVDLALLQAEFASYTAKPPAAFDVRLYNAAKAHSLDLIARDAQDHTGQLARVGAAGFDYVNFAGIVFSYSENPVYGHAAFNIDWGNDGGDGSGMQPGRGHRMAIMAVNSDYPNFGIAVVPETNAGTAVGPQVTTGNFCRADTSTSNHYNRFIVGTVWTDSNSNSQYDPGEGIAGVTAMPDQGGYFAVTSNSGGYAIPATSSGTWTISFSGSAISGTVDRSVAVGSQSALLDLVYASGAIVPEVNTSAASSVTATSAKLNGTVNANGTACIYYFEYGPTAAYGTSTVSYSTSANSSVAVTVTGLTTGATYHFRLVASNANGTSLGADRSFVASASSTPPPQQSSGGSGGGGCFVSAITNPSDLSASGTIAALGLAMTAVFLTIWIVCAGRKKPPMAPRSG